MTTGTRLKNKNPLPLWIKALVVGTLLSTSYNYGLYRGKQIGIDIAFNAIGEVLKKVERGAVITDL